MKPSFTLSVKLEGFTRHTGPFCLAFGVLKNEDIQKLERDLVSGLSKLCDKNHVVELRQGITGDFGRKKAIAGMVSASPRKAQPDWKMEMDMGILRKYIEV